MPGQKKRYNVRFPPSRIKKIMQKNTEVGRIAMAVPVIIAQALEMFLKTLLTKTCLITQSKFSSVVSLAHMKQCIKSEKLFHFLKDSVEKGTQRDSIWPVYRTTPHDVSAKKAAEVVEKSEGLCVVDSVDNDSSTSEAELYICL